MNLDNFKVVILAGGMGTRISEYTKEIPKPMIEIKNKPILIQILKIYIKSGINNFIIATGYKNQIINNYFLKNKNLIKILFRNKKKIKILFKLNNKICKICLYFTGLKTMTGGRLKRIKDELVNKNSFMLTYGDGLANINIKNLIKFHLKKNCLATVTAVHPIARFGMIELNKNYMVKTFKEKKQTKKDWINGGFFVFKNEFLKYLKNDSTVLEGEPLEKLSKQKKLFAYKHKGFWMCMDTKRDRDNLDKVYSRYFK